MHDKKKFLLFDTVVLSNFALTDEGIPFLKKRYADRGVITLQVLEEMAKANFSGWQPFDQFESKLFKKNGFQKTSLTEQEQLIYIPLLKNLGSGEASCIAVACQRNGVVVTDDRVARNFSKEKNVPVTGTIGILKAACLDKVIDLDQADHMLQQMVLFGFYSPIQKLSDIL